MKYSYLFTVMFSAMLTKQQFSGIAKEGYFVLFTGLGPTALCK